MKVAGFVFLCTTFASSVLASDVNRTLNSSSTGSCISEWMTCSPSDDGFPCCAGLYCWVQDEYYAQCRAADGGSPTPSPSANPPPTPPTPTLGGYACGSPITGQTDYVKSQYAAWKNEYLVSNLAGMCVARPGQGDDCVSEGLGYGMILSAYLDDKATFDGLWAFAQYTSDANGLPNWRTSTSGEVWGLGSAADADLDIGFALLLAADAFTSGNENSAYLASARTFLAAVLTHDLDPATLLVKPGDGWEGDVAFNPSYFAPGYFALFAGATGSAEWVTAASNGWAFLKDKCPPYSVEGSGLLPDWTESLTSCAPGTDVKASDDKDSGSDYYYDAIRVPWRLSTAAVWTCDEDALSWTSNLANFFNSQGVEGMQQGFTVQGESLGGGDSNCFLSTAATAMIPAQSTSSIDTWWAATTTNDAGLGLYFCDVLKMLSIVFQTGLFQLPSVAGVNVSKIGSRT